MTRALAVAPVAPALRYGRGAAGSVLAAFAAPPGWIVPCDSSSASRLACRSKSAASTGRRRLPAGPCWRLLPCGKSVSGRLGACRVALPPCLVPCDSSECCRLSPATVPPPAPARLPAGEGRECRQHPTTCRLTPKILYWYDILPINLPVNIVL